MIAEIIQPPRTSEQEPRNLVSWDAIQRRADIFFTPEIVVEMDARLGKPIEKGPFTFTASRIENRDVKSSYLSHVYRAEVHGDEIACMINGISEEDGQLKESKIIVLYGHARYGAGIELSAEQHTSESSQSTLFKFKVDRDHQKERSVLVSEEAWNHMHPVSQQELVYIFNLKP